MVGPTKANGYIWNTKGPVFSSYAYVPEDAGAWDSVRVHYGTMLSCRADNGSYNSGYTGPCVSKVGPKNPVTYSCQGTNCASRTDFFSGQCKAFLNLVLYRSGVYHKPGGWRFSTLPLDRNIPSVAHLATPGTLRPGDALRSVNGHAALVVSVIDRTHVVVFDSNFLGRPELKIGGDGYEHSGSHVMTFGGSPAYNDLGKYYVLNCVYDGTCS